jgi:glycerol-3-phosphate dehydrogenase
MVATTVAEQATLHADIIPKAERNGVAVSLLTPDEIAAFAPAVTDQAREGVLIEGEAIIDPFWTTRAYCENAMLNGATVILGATVTGLSCDDHAVTIHTTRPVTTDSPASVTREQGPRSEGNARYSAKLVVNAAGLWADEVARLVDDESFLLTPRKGEFLITEEEIGVGQIILPVPSKITKGILAAPIVFGGTLLGPTAEDIPDKRDLATTARGLAQVRAGVAKLVPAAASVSSIRQFAGLRAVSSTGDYIIGPSPVSGRLLHVAGIRSTGLSASPAIGRHAAEMVRSRLGLRARSDFQPELPAFLDRAQPDEGDVICLCRNITRGEIAAALRSPLPPQSLDGLKRRTGAMLGDCQGNLCAPRIVALMAVALARDPLTLEKHIAGSRLFAGAISHRPHLDLDREPRV